MKGLEQKGGKRISAALVFLLFVSVGCAPNPPGPTSEPLPPTFTPLPTSTRTPTPTPTIAPSPTALASPTPTEIPIAGYQLIMTLVDNASLGSAMSLAFSPDSSLLAAGYNAHGIQNAGDNIVRIWEMDNGCLKYELINDSQLNWSLAISSNGKLVASSFLGVPFLSGVPEIQLWNLSSQSMMKAIDTNNSFSRSLEFSPDGEMLLSAEDDSANVRLVPDENLVHSFKADHNIRAVDFSPDGKQIAASTYQGNDIFVWRLHDGALLHQIDQKDDPSPNNDEASVAVKFSPDGSLLATTYKNKVSLWDLQAEKVVREFSADSGYEVFGGIIFSPDGRFLLGVAGIPGYVRSTKVYIWDFQGSALVRVIERPAGDLLYSDLRSLAMSPNGMFLALGSQRYLDLNGKIFVYGIPGSIKKSSCPAPQKIDR